MKSAYDAMDEGPLSVLLAAVLLWAGVVARAQDPSPERIAEVLFRLENDVLGTATYAGPRIATVKVGDPIELPEKLTRREPQHIRGRRDQYRKSEAKHPGR